MKFETVENLSAAELDALLANYDKQARRLRSEAFKTGFSDWFASVRAVLRSTFVQEHKLAHASE